MASIILDALASAWLRVRGHALRQAIGALLFATYTACIWRVWPDSAVWPEKHNFYRRQWVEGMLWGAIAAVSLNASCLGNIGKKSFERSLGMFVGGWLGYALALARLVKLRSPWGAVVSAAFALSLGLLGSRPATRIGLALTGAWLGVVATVYCEREFWFVATAAAVTYVAYFLGDVSRLAGAGRLGMIAFFVVHWGVLDAQNALFIAASRIACIQVAVVQLAMLSVLISPDIASERAVGSVRAAMKASEAFAALALHAEEGDGDLAPSPAKSGHIGLELAGQTGGAEAQGSTRDGSGRPSAAVRLCSAVSRLLRGDTAARTVAGKRGRNPAGVPGSTAGGGEGATGLRLGQDAGVGAPAGGSEPGERGAQAAAEAAAFRTALEKMAAHSATAVSEWYLGSWRGRHWYLPTLTWHNERKQRRGTFHLPEREMRAFAAAARQAFGSLEGLHASLAPAEVPCPVCNCPMM